MPRRVQDIVPQDRRSIRDIPTEDTSQKKSASSAHAGSSHAKKTHELEREVPLHRISIAPPPAPIKPKSRRQKIRVLRFWPALLLIVIVIIAGGGYVTSSYFSRADFTIVPKTLPVSVNGTYVAAPTATAGALTYQLVTLQSTATSTVPAIDGKVVSTKATGIVILYNAYSSQAVRLIAGTRIANDSGLIYRLTGSVVIPGYTKSGTSMIPGSTKSTVIADQPGQAYNISRTDSQSDFKIVAYAGGPRYSTIYARLAGDMTGGLQGLQKTVDPSVMASTTSALKTILTASLLAKAKNLVPSDTILYDNADIIRFGSATVGGGNTNTAQVSLSGTLYAFEFKRADLVSRLAGDSLNDFGSYSYTPFGLDNLAFMIANPSDFSLSKKPTLVIHLKGSFTVVGVIPVAQIQKQLAGKALSETQNIFKSYGSLIESGSGELTPPWAHVPTDTSRINITVKNPTL